VLIIRREFYDHLLYDGAVIKSVREFSPAHYEHPSIVHGFRQSPWSMTGWRPPFGFPGRGPEPMPQQLTPSKAIGTSIQLLSLKNADDRRPDRVRKLTSAPGSRFNKRRLYSWNGSIASRDFLCESPRRVVFNLFPQHFQNRTKNPPKVFCARLLESEKFRRRARIRLSAPMIICGSANATAWPNIEKGLRAARIASARPLDKV